MDSDVRGEIAYLCMKMNVSKAVQSDRACSSRLCNDCTLRGPEMEMSTNLTQEDGKESARAPYHLLRHCWPFRLCPIRAATSAQDIPAELPPCWDIIDFTITVNSSTSSGVQAPMWRNIRQYDSRCAHGPLPLRRSPRCAR